jgi:hypothetical protein
MRRSEDQIPTVLILALPKSASTSLMQGLGDVLDLSAGQAFTLKPSSSVLKLRSKLGARIVRNVKRLLGIRISSPNDTMRDLFPCPDFAHIGRLHSDICDFRSGGVPRRFWRFGVHKQHFPPTPGNISALAHLPTVLLTRTPKTAAQAYLRISEENARRNLHEVVGADGAGISYVETDLEQWIDGWSDALKGRPDVVVVRFEDLVENPGRVIERICGSLGLADVSLGDNYSLPRLRYSRSKN